MALNEELNKQGNFLFKHRSYFPLVFLFTGLLVDINHEQNSAVDHFSRLNIYQYTCFFISLAGFVLRIITVGYSTKNTSGRNTARQVADTLNTTGSYSTCRHPLYTGNFLMWLGVAMLTGNTWFIVSFVLVYWLYYERIMYAEEQFLRSKFSTEYLQWAEKTPAIIPNIHKWEKPLSYFSFKKVLKFEKSGLLNLTVVFFIFEATEAVNIEYLWTNKLVWTILLIIGLLTYLILKFIENKTTLLKDDSF